MFRHFLVMSVDADRWPIKSIIMQGVPEQGQAWSHMLLATNEAAKGCFVFEITGFETPEPTFTMVGYHEV